MEKMGVEGGHSVRGYPTGSDQKPPMPVGRQRHFSGSVRRQPSLLNGVRDLLHRPRAESLGEKMFKRTEVVRKVQISACEVTEVYDLRDEQECFYDDEEAFRRPRSNSSDFLILRKTSRPLSVHVVGLVDAHNDPYRQYMKVVDCYELAPAFGKIIVVDQRLPVKKSFEIMRENKITSLLVWCSDIGFVSCLTLTDLMVALKTMSASDDISKIPTYRVLQTSRLISVSISSKIIDACQMLLNSKLHRLAVLDDEGNCTYLLTIRRVLQAIHKQNRSLHFVQWLNLQITKCTVGTFGEIVTINSHATLLEAAEKMISLRLSSLPVVAKDGRVIGTIAKRDIAFSIPLDNTKPKEFLQSKTVNSIFTKTSESALIPDTSTVGFVLDALLPHSLRCVFIVNSKQEVIGAVSLSDVLSFMLRASDSEQNTPSSSGSSVENVEPKMM